MLLLGNWFNVAFVPHLYVVSQGIPSGMFGEQRIWWAHLAHTIGVPIYFGPQIK